MRTIHRDGFRSLFPNALVGDHFPRAANGGVGDQLPLADTRGADGEAAPSRRSGLFLKSKKRHYLLDVSSLITVTGAMACKSALIFSASPTTTMTNP